MNHVDAFTLFSGAWYALEQAGNLLDSAVLLFDEGDHATAVGIAMLAREEIGKFRTLEDLGEQASKGTIFTLKHVGKVCRDHRAKQAHGILGLTFEVDRDSDVGRLLGDRAKVSPSSPESKSAERAVAQLVETTAAALPDQRHDLRMAAMYLDLDDSGRWLRPSVVVDRKQAERELRDAWNDYRGQRERLRPESICQDYPDMAATRDNMIPAPRLKEVRMVKSGT